MHVIKMNADKSLVTTVRANIYQGENNADTLVFLVPMTYESINLASCQMLVWYKTPNNVEHFEGLYVDSEPYKNHYRYRLGITSEITSVPGRIELRLTAVDTDNDIVLKSDSSFISVIPMSNAPELDEDSEEGIIEFDSDMSDDTDDDPNSIGGEIIQF